MTRTERGTRVKEALLAAARSGSRVEILTASGKVQTGKITGGGQDSVLIDGTHYSWGEIIAVDLVDGEVAKFNPNHDERGRFTTSDHAGGGAGGATPPAARTIADVARLNRERAEAERQKEEAGRYHSRHGITTLQASAVGYDNEAKVLTVLDKLIDKYPGVLDDNSTDLTAYPGLKMVNFIGMPWDPSVAGQTAPHQNFIDFNSDMFKPAVDDVTGLSPHPENPTLVGENLVVRAWQNGMLARDTTWIEGIVTHEFAHRLQFHLGAKRALDGVGKVIAQEFPEMVNAEWRPSEYAGASWQEFWAEMFVHATLTDPEAPISRRWMQLVDEQYRQMHDKGYAK
jgi:hypothetical protein